MPCLFALVAVLFPRIAAVIVWLARPGIYSQAFNGGWLLPILGVIFMPLTTVVYVVLWGPNGGFTTTDFILLVIAIILDISHWGSNIFNVRDRIPGYTSFAKAKE